MSETPNKPPLISVILPVYNAENYVAEAVESILNQTLRDFELILIDDGSIDGSLGIMKRYAAHDSRVVIVSRDNRGLVASLNEGINLARGQWIARMDADDISHPERFERQVEVLRNDPNLDLVGACALAIDELGQPLGLLPSGISHEEITARPWRGFYLAHPTWMGKAEWFRQYRYLTPAPFRCEDQELLLRSFRDSKFSALRETLLAYRIRNHIDWKALRRTRLAIFSMQVGYFSKSHEWHLIALSALALIAKLTKDAISRIMGSNPIPMQFPSSEFIFEEWLKATRPEL
ncbi:MAG: glycosyltransferase family 2 protein [Rugosibacter sp.]|nr:glycosyltransferase family 2 protein [Rugosibacter sp.]